MISTTVFAIAMAASNPATAAQPAAAPAPSAEKTMACCDKMAKGEDCCCCKGDEGEDMGAAAPAHGEHGSHDL